MTEYAPPRSSQDFNFFVPAGSPGMSHYPNHSGINYLFNNGSHVQYPTVNTNYSTYPTQCLPAQHSTNSTAFLSNSSSMAFNTYQPSFARAPIIPSQPRAVAATPLLSPQYTQRLSNRETRYEVYPIPDTESQESFNEENQASEPVEPAMEGYPDVKDFDDLMKQYVAGLSPKKQDKALIHARRAANIRAVLIDKKTTAVESAQFRFWVKKMFTLQVNDLKAPDKKKKICHEGKPVAVREKLYKILIKAHKQCQHGGRDKTSAQVRKVYSWVPKELISRFVKLCPTCQVRRGGASARTSPPDSDRDSYMHTRSSGLISPPQSRRESIAARKSSMSIHSPAALGARVPSDFQRQNRWMTPTQSNHSSSAAIHNIPLSNYHTIPASSPMSAIGSLNSTHGPNNSHTNFNTPVHNDNQAAYNSNTLRFAHTSQSAFPYSSTKQEGHF